MTKPGTATPSSTAGKAAADAAKKEADDKWAAEQKRKEEREKVKADRQQFLSAGGIATADLNPDAAAPEAVQRMRKRQDVLLQLKLIKKQARNPKDALLATIAYKAAKAKYKLKDAADTTLVDKSKDGDLLPKIRTATSHKEKLRSEEPSLQEVRDGAQHYTDEAIQAGKTFEFTVFKIDVPALWAKDGGAPLPFDLGELWGVWSKTMTTSALGYEELEEDGWTQLKVQRHLEKGVTPDLRGKFFPWLKKELEKHPVDEARIKAEWEKSAATMRENVATMTKGYIEKQILARKGAKAALTDFKVDSAVEVTKAAFSIAAAIGLTVGTMGTFSPFAIITIIRGGLTFFNEAVKQFADEARIAAIVRKQIAGIYALRTSTQEMIEEEYARAVFEGRKEDIPADQLAGLSEFVTQAVSNFFKSELAPTVGNVKTMTETHGHKVTQLKNMYSHLVDVQKALERYKAQWGSGDVKKYLDGLSKKELDAVYATKMDYLQLSKRLESNMKEASIALDQHLNKMTKLVTATKAASRLQKSFEESVAALDAKVPSWTNVAVGLFDGAVTAGLGFGDALTASTAVEQNFGITQTAEELAEVLTELKTTVQESKEYKALAAKVDKETAEMKKQFEALAADAMTDLKPQLEKFRKKVAAAAKKSKKATAKGK